MKHLVSFAGRWLIWWFTVWRRGLPLVSAELVAREKCIAKSCEIFCVWDESSARPFVGDVNVRSVSKQSTFTSNIMPRSNTIGIVLRRVFQSATQGYVQWQLQLCGCQWTLTGCCKLPNTQPAISSSECGDREDKQWLRWRIYELVSIVCACNVSTYTLLL